MPPINQTTDREELPLSILLILIPPMFIFCVSYMCAIHLVYQCIGSVENFFERKWEGKNDEEKTPEGIDVDEKMDCQKGDITDEENAEDNEGEMRKDKIEPMDYEMAFRGAPLSYGAC